MVFANEGRANCFFWPIRAHVPYHCQGVRIKRRVNDFGSYMYRLPAQGFVRSNCIVCRAVCVYLPEALL